MIERPEESQTPASAGNTAGEASGHIAFSYTKYSTARQVRQSGAAMTNSAPQLDPSAIAYLSTTPQGGRYGR
jgi:hypothetical protein